MKKWRKRLAVFAGCVIVISVIFIFNQFMQLYRNLAYLHPLLAAVVVGAFSLAAIYLLIITIKGLISLPKEIELADGAGPEEYADYVQRVYEQLKQNPTLKAQDFEWEKEPFKVTVPNPEGKVADPLLEARVEATSFQIKRAHTHLREVALIDIKSQAQTVFLSTAISQNGALDSLTVMVVLVRLVWRLIKLYDTRPSLGKILAIYTHVASTIIMARGIEDLDLIEAQLEPLISSIIGGSLLSLIPGSVNITNLIASSIMEGSINALLALRVGILTVSYLASLEDIDPVASKRNATVEATKLLGQIIKDGSVSVIQLVAKSVKNAGVETTKKWNPFSKNAAGQ